MPWLPDDYHFSAVKAWVVFDGEAISRHLRQACESRLRADMMTSNDANPYSTLAHPACMCELSQHLQPFTSMDTRNHMYLKNDNP